MIEPRGGSEEGAATMQMQPGGKKKAALAAVCVFRGCMLLLAAAAAQVSTLDAMRSNQLDCSKARLAAVCVGANVAPGARSCAALPISQAEAVAAVRPGLSQCQSGCSMQRCVERCVQRSRRVWCALCAPARLPPAARRGAGASAHAAAVGPGARVEHALASQRITCCCQLHPALCGAEMRQRVPSQVTRRTVSDAAPHLGIAAAR